MDEPPEPWTDSNSLLRAVYLSRLRLTRLLLEGGAYINESNEHGETPLMIACKTRHTDPQSVPKIKMVRYLLENGADPNIQDKTGKTALIHACLEQSGSEVLSLLLSSGADPTLEDHAGLSALVYAVGSGNRDVLNVLLDACKGRGKEVIIITSNPMTPGQQKTKQFLGVPPPAEPEESLRPAAASGCVEAQIPTSLETSSPLRVPEVRSQPGSPVPHPSPSRGSDVDTLHLHRMLSELGSKSPSGSSPVPRGRPPAVSRHHSVDIRDAAGLHRALDNTSAGQNKGRPAFGRKMSYDSAAMFLHSASHPSGVPVPDGSGSEDEGRLGLLNLEEHQQNISLEHYSSDSQLQSFDCREKPSRSSGTGSGQERHKLVHSRPPTLSGSKESIQRRGPAGLERRGSGAFLLDHIAHTRPGYLPPLNPHTPIPDIRSGSSLPPTGSKKTLTGPTGSKPALHQDLNTKKMLWRRHSMQSEQIRQLRHFQEASGLDE